MGFLFFYYVPARFFGADFRSGIDYFEIFGFTGGFIGCRIDILFGVAFTAMSFVMVMGAQ